MAKGRPTFREIAEYYRLAVYIRQTTIVSFPPRIELVRARHTCNKGGCCDDRRVIATFSSDYRPYIGSLIRYFNLPHSSGKETRWQEIHRGQEKELGYPRDLCSWMRFIRFALKGDARFGGISPWARSGWRWRTLAGSVRRGYKARFVQILAEWENVRRYATAEAYLAEAIAFADARRSRPRQAKAAVETAEPELEDWSSRIYDPWDEDPE